MNLSNRDRKKQKQRRWSSASKRFKSDPSPVSDISSSCIFSSKFFFLYTLSLSIERPGKSNDSSLSIDREREHTKILFFRTGGILKKKNCHSQNSWRGRGGASAGSGGGRSFFSFLFFPQNNTLNILHLKPRASPSFSSFRNATATFALRKDHKEGERRSFFSRKQKQHSSDKKRSGQSRENGWQNRRKLFNFLRPPTHDPQAHFFLPFSAPPKFHRASLRVFRRLLPSVPLCSAIAIFFTVFSFVFFGLFPKKNKNSFCQNEFKKHLRLFRNEKEALDSWKRQHVFKRRPGRNIRSCEPARGESGLRDFTHERFYSRSRLRSSFFFFCSLLSRQVLCHLEVTQD